MHSDEELQRFLAETVSQDESSSIEAWLEQDPSRWRRLEGLADDPQLVARLRDSLPEAIYHHEPEFQRAMAETSVATQATSPTVPITLGSAAEVEEAAPLCLAGYRMIRKLGSGGMGAVYEAEHELMHKRVAVKVMAPRFLEDSVAVERFMSEMVVIGKLNDPNLVRGLDARRENGRLYLVMEYLEGEDLAAYRKRKGPLPLHESCDLIRQAALGLAHAHDQGIIHRDIKPINLMVTGDGIVKVLDLGLARLESTQSSGHLTSDQMIVGTPDYISPEQIQSPRDVDARADIYSLGCTLFFLLTGDAPFQQHANPMPKLMAHVNESPTLPDDIRETIPAALAQVLTKLMEKDRDLRFQSARDVVEAMAAFSQPQALENEPIPATQLQNTSEFNHIASSQASRKRPVRWPRIGLAAAVPLMLLAAFGITLLLKTKDGIIQLKFADGSQLAAIDVGKDQTITIKDPHDDKRIEIAVDREQRMLRLKKEGFEVLTKDFQLNVDGQKIEVTFIPIPPATTESSQPSVAIVEEPEQPNTADSEQLNPIAISHRGDWQIDGDEIVQTKVAVPGQLLTFGDPTWSEYNLSFEGRVPNQTRVHGFSGMFQLKSPREYVAFGVGIYYNRGHEVSRSIAGNWHRNKGMYTEGAIEPEKWHQVRIKVRGATAHCYLDDQLLFVSEEPLFSVGQCGLATYDTRARFRNIRVETPDGKILWKGPPKSIQKAD